MLNALLLALMLTAQPANADNVTASVQGIVDNFSFSSYLPARDANGGFAASGYVSMGQQYAETAYQVKRGFLAFPIPAGERIVSCSLFLNGWVDSSATDFAVDIVGANLARPTITTADYSRFNGRTVGSAHTGTVLNNTWNSSSYSADWNTITLNAAGIDSLNAAIGDTLWIALLSHKDYTASAPTGYEYIAFVPSPAPYLSITRLPVSRNIPYSLTPTPLYDKSPVPLYRGY
jgi:hypothetical protein